VGSGGFTLLGPKDSGQLLLRPPPAGRLEGNGSFGGLVVGGFELVEHGRFEVGRFRVVVVAHGFAA
jgi:hypothetical protein